MTLVKKSKRKSLKETKINKDFDANMEPIDLSEKKEKNTMIKNYILEFILIIFTKSNPLMVLV